MATNWKEIGLTLLRKGLKERNLQGLVTHCECWLKAAPDIPFPWYLLGLAYQNMSLYHLAINAFREVLRLDPGDHVAGKSLVISYYAIGKRDAALEAIRELRPYAAEKANKLLDFIVMPSHGRLVEADEDRGEHR